MRYNVWRDSTLLQLLKTGIYIFFSKKAIVILSRDNARITLNLKGGFLWHITSSITPPPRSSSAKAPKKKSADVPNPHVEKVYEGIDLCKKEKVDFILAVGGGSVIDSAKAIAYGLVYEGDVWDLFAKEKPLNACGGPKGSAKLLDLEYMINVYRMANQYRISPSKHFGRARNACPAVFDCIIHFSSFACARMLSASRIRRVSVITPLR